MPLTLSDASSDDWACVGVRILSIALIPQGGGSAVTIYSAATPAPYVNLELLDQLGEILGNVSIPAGTYSGALLTIGANPGDVLLTVAANPEQGFPLTPGSSVPSDEIQIQHTQGTSGNLRVPVTVNFDTPLAVSSSQSNVALDLEFNLAHPAFIVGHTPPAADGATLWAVNFAAPVRRHPIHDIARLVLRHTYGTVSAVSSAALTVTKDFPVYPATNPETEITSTISLTVNADGTNGTIVYDLDAGTRTVVDNFSAESGLANRYVRIAARYQEDGTLTAVRVWVSSDFSKVWLSPEGHVLNVNTNTDVITVTNEDGIPVPVTIDATTEFFYRVPQNALADATPIGSGTGFLTSQDLVRGFKVHVSAVDPLAVPLVAQTVDIETANFGGYISNATTSGLTYTSNYLAQNDDYSLTLNYIASTTANGENDQDVQITGFDWWYFTLPTLVNYGTGAPAAFVAAADGAVNFGGTVGTVAAFGESRALWGDGASNTSNWYLRDVVIMPTPIPLGTVSTAYAANAFAMTVANGAVPVTVNVSTTPGSATLVYQVDRANGIVTVSPIDITSSSGLATMTAALSVGAPVKVYGVPQAPVAPAAGTLRAYVLVYYTGTIPSM
ncbi:MAG TPA: DUF4382 domain-containing protein [Steroidobacteraceae bacterium]|nr:DUF4382 domain-containing protein [Steroidobacteraceae bacterium]